MAAQIGEGDPVPYEEALSAPFRFDVDIGYWTGEPDLELLAQALAAAPIDPAVERRVTAAGVRLRGAEPAVREQARLLRAAGLT
jgi:hypothetical protein